MDFLNSNEKRILNNKIVFLEEENIEMVISCLSEEFNELYKGGLSDYNSDLFNDNIISNSELKCKISEQIIELQNMYSSYLKLQNIYSPSLMEYFVN